MANYFQDPSQSFVPTPVYRPPFEALQNTLTTKQGKYDVGLEAVRAARNSVFNAAITNPLRGALRDKYIAEAGKKLQDLSQVDLSIESNQMAAKNVYGSFFKDEGMIRDMAYTSSQGSQISKFNSFKAEKDSFEYADPRSLQDMQNGMDKVRNASLDDMSVYQVREFTPFTDITKYMSKMVVDQKIAIEKVSSDGMITYKKTNGPESIGNWTTIASAMTQDRFNKQFQVEARVGKEEGIKRIKESIKQSTGANISDREALGMYIDNQYKNNYVQFGKQKDDYNEALVKATTLRNKAIKENPDLPLAELDAYNQQIKQYSDGLTSVTKSWHSYDPKGDKYKTAVQTFQDNPDGVLYDNIRNSTISNLANYFAANESQSIPVADPRYIEGVKANQQIIDNNRADIKTTNETQKATDDHAEHLAKANGTWKGGDGSGGAGANGKPLTAAQMKEQDVNGLHYVGLQGNDYTELSPTDRFNKEQQTKFDLAHSVFLDPDGTAGILEGMSNGTISYGEIVAYTTALQDGKSSSKFNAEEKGVAIKVEKLLKDNGIKLDSNSKYGVARGLHNLAGVYFNKIKGTDKWNEKTTQMWRDDNTAGENMIQFNNMNKMKSDAVIEHLSKSEYKNLLVDRGNGVKDVVNSGDLDKDIKDLNGSLKNYYGNFSKLYLRGDVHIEDELITSGRTVGSYATGRVFIKVKGQDIVTVDNPRDAAILKNLQAKWGTSEKISKAVAEANKITIAKLPGYTQNDAQMGQEFTYHVGETPKDSDMGMRVIKQTTLPGNFDVPILDNGGDIDDVKSLIGKIHNWGAKEIGEYMNPPKYHTNNGAPSIVLSFKSLTDAQLTQIGIERKDLPQTIELPLKDNPSPDLQSLLHPNSGMYTYNQLLQGKPYKSTSLEKGLNFDYEMIPNRTSNPDSVRLTIRRKAMNSKGEMEEVPLFTTQLSFKDFTPDEMKAKVDDVLAKHIQFNTDMQSQVTKASKNITEEQKIYRAALKKRNDDFNATLSNN